MPPRSPSPVALAACYLWAASLLLSWGGAAAATPVEPVAAAATPVAPTATTTPAGLPPTDANACLTCHRDLPDEKLRTVAEQFERSVHRDERIGCAGCHGGAPTDPTVRAHDPAAGFVVRPAQARISEICGGCHEDPIFVRRFDARLPIDQRKLFELSRHGKLANAGDRRAPACTSCHGVHDVARVGSPDAPVSDGRVVPLCAGCHADPSRMAPFGIEADQVDHWEKSVHGRAFRGGNHAAPTCKGCHSPHAGKLPGAAAVEALCDRCHADERDLFRSSPHAKPFRRLGLGECVPCHGSHEVAPPVALAGMTPDSACERCHAHDERPRGVARQIGASLAGLDREADAAAAALARARREGLAVPAAEQAMARAKSARLELAAATHTLDAAQIDKGARAARPMLDQVVGDVDRARAAHDRERRGYLAALFVAVLLFGLLVAKAVVLARRRSRAP